MGSYRHLPFKSRLHYTYTYIEYKRITLPGFYLAGCQPFLRRSLFDDYCQRSLCAANNHQKASGVTTLLCGRYSSQKFMTLLGLLIYMFTTLAHVRST